MVRGIKRSIRNRRWLFALPVAAVVVSAAPAYAFFGELDPSFDGDPGNAGGGNGKVTTPIGAGTADDQGEAVAIQPDGKIVVAGSATGFGGGFDFAVARYNTDGTLDSSFSGDGVVTTPIGPGTNTDLARAVAIQSDGDIVAVGEANTGATNGTDFALVRYNGDDGSLDTAGFGGGDGIVTTPIGPTTAGDVIFDVKIDSGGKIVAGGISAPGATGNDFAVARYNTDGTLDTAGFGAGSGFVTTDFTGGGGSDAAFGLAIQSDGKIVAAGFADGSTPGSDFALGRYNTNGTLDDAADGDPGVTFSLDGKTTTSLSGNDLASDVAIQSDGKIVVVGVANTTSDNDFGLARYNPSDGSLDTGFDGDPGNAGGGDGKVITAFPSGQASGLAIQPDGKLVVVGRSITSSGEDFALARYNGSNGAADGTLDDSFAGDGTTTTRIAPGTAGDVAADVAIQSDGKIVAAGTASFDDTTSTGADIALTRYGPDVSIPQTTITSGPSGITADTTPTFRFSSNEPGSTFQCSIDGGAFSACSSPRTVGLGAGSHTFRVRATDPFAHTDLSPASRSFEVVTEKCGGRTPTVIGTTGPDAMSGTGGPDVFLGRAGNDRFIGMGSGDIACGGPGRDRLSGGSGNDRLKGGGGNDKLKGGGGNDKLKGGPGNDKLKGGGGNDRCGGGGGRNRLSSC